MRFPQEAVDEEEEEERAVMEEVETQEEVEKEVEMGAEEEERGMEAEAGVQQGEASVIAFHIAHLHSWKTTVATLIRYDFMFLKLASTVSVLTRLRCAGFFHCMDDERQTI